MKELLELFFDKGYLLSREMLDTLFDINREMLDARYPEYKGSFNGDRVIDILYSIGFLGVVHERKSAFVYDEPRAVRPDIKYFVVHPCFREALRSTHSVGVTPFKRSRSMARFGQRGAIGMDVYSSSPIVTHPSIRPRSQYIEVFSSVLRNLQPRIAKTASISDLPNEFFEEVQHNFASMREDMERAMHRDASSPVIAINLAEDILTYLRQLREELPRRGIRDRDIGISVEDAISALEKNVRYLYVE